MTCCTFFVVSHQSYASRPISFRVSVRTPDRDAQRASSICERRTLACCTYSAPWMLLEASVTSAEAARGRAFIDPNMAGRSHGLRSCFSVRRSFESRTMIVPHQSPSACQTELTGSSSSSTVAGDQRNLLMPVAIRSSWPLRWCLSAPSHCTRTLPIPGHLCSEAQSLPTVLAAR